MEDNQSDELRNDSAPIQPETPPLIVNEASPIKTSNRSWKYAIIITVVALVGGALGIGGMLLLQSQSQLSSQTPAEHSNPTPTPAPTITQSTKVLFHDSRGGMSLADENGDHVEHIIKGDKIGFAGASRDSKTIYYTIYTRASNNVELHKYIVATKQDSKLIQFTTNSSVGNLDEVNGPGFEVANVRPDGKYALLQTKEGITLYNFTDKSQKVLLKNISSNPEFCGATAQAPSRSDWLSWLIKPVQAAIACQQYSNPRYSSDGNRALINVFYYENGGAIIIDPTDGTTIKDFGATAGQTMFGKDGKSVIQAGTSKEELGAGLSYFPSLTSDAVNLVADKSAFGTAFIQSFGLSADNRVFAIGWKMGASDLSIWVINLTDQSHKLVGDLHTKGSSLGSLWLHDNISALYALNGKVFKINTQTGITESWVSQALSPIAILQ